MSTEQQLFTESLASVGVETRRVPPAAVAEAIAELLIGETVAVTLDHDDVSLPDTVTIDPTPSELHAAQTGITPAAFAIADYGSVVLPSTAAGSELVSLYVDHHIAIVDEQDIVADMEHAFDRFGRQLSETYGSAIVATGPSATADMGSLVTGAHGPSTVSVVVVEG
ncbi:LutC/YkgG family protein [Halocatena pleomorpha]|uniref:Lactate utilization protein C n=1 Tax=Halocatena pleomorpha TaxID=1785090 RepID=A0A3P3RLP3_9EURY|nr:LUD domain-containing protein [Halocatena pleomorpha]RRJ33818.1 lactate utilization protein C [Halocatena pleomorpha]